MRGAWRGELSAAGNVFGGFQYSSHFLPWRYCVAWTWRATWAFKRSTKGQLTIFGSVPALFYPYYHGPIFSLEFQRKHRSYTWQWGAVKTHHLIVQWILNANKPTDEWRRWEESHLPRTRILRAMIGPACFAIGLIWVSRKGRCECKMIRRASWIGSGNLIISVQACEKDGEANVGADYFIWKPLSPYCIYYLQSTVKSRISVSIIFNHIFSLQFTWGIPVLFSTWADCSCLWKEKSMFMLMTNEQCQHMLASKPNINSATVQHKLYASSQRLYARGTNQNETLLCWILWMSASTYSSMNLFQAPSVRTVEDDTLTHGCDG